MKSVRAWGNVETASVLVIGHDPRLQKSLAEAKHAFFFEFLQSPRPTSIADAAKYDLARAVWNYVNELAGQMIPLSELYVTNLCNRFLDHIPSSGTVLIPASDAQQGVKEAEELITGGHFRVILPMSVQVFYHLCRLKFLDEDTDEVRHFVRLACPKENKAKQGIYAQTGTAPFLKVCGLRFHHHTIPVVPIVHIKQWPLKPRFRKYQTPMERAKNEIRCIFSAQRS